MDDVSGLADKSGEFANFLTVSRKYGITYVYIFYTIYPKYTRHIYYITRQNWQKIMSHGKIFIFFQGLFRLLLMLEFYLHLQVDMDIIIYLIEIFGLIDYILKYQILDKSNAWQLTYVMLTTYYRVNLGHKQTIGQYRFVFIIEIKNILVLIIFWQ